MVTVAEQIALLRNDMDSTDSENRNKNHERRLEVLEEIAKKYPLSCVKWEKVRFYGNILEGDHVSYYNWAYAYWMHAIVVGKTNTERPQISIIKWSNNRREIVREERDLELGSWSNLYRAVYTKGCYPDTNVVRRAQARIRETEYSWFRNCACAFPQWCKTGQGRYNNDNAANTRYLSAIAEMQDQSISQEQDDI